MKKLILIFALLIIAGAAYASTITLTTSDAFIVSKDNDVYTWTYTLPNVVGSATTRFKIPVPSIAGNIKQVSWNSTSDNCTVWIAGKDNEDQGGIYESVAFSSTGSYSPELSAPRYFRNRDTVEAAVLYVAVTNGDTDNATDAEISLTFGR